MKPSRKLQTRGRLVGARGAGGAMAPTNFGRSVNPISTRGSRLCPPNDTGNPGFSDLSTALGYIKKTDNPNENSNLSKSDTKLDAASDCDSDNELGTSMKGKTSVKSIPGKCIANKSYNEYTAYFDRKYSFLNGFSHFYFNQTLVPTPQCT